jgi:thiol-disulfide isomerase/thioredoxin
MQYQTRLTRKFIWIAIFIFACSSSGKIQKIDDSGITSLTSQEKVVVLNFWATWCQPCVEEIPIFIRLQQQHPEIDVVGISMDEPDQTGAVEAFVRKHEMNYKVVLREGENFETMVNSIDPEWMGALPATFVFKDGKRTFSKAGLISEQELLQAIQ